MTKVVNTHQMNLAHSLWNVGLYDNTPFEIDHNIMELWSKKTGLLQSKSPPCSMSLDYPKFSGESASQPLSTYETDALQNQMKAWLHINSGIKRNLTSCTSVFGGAQQMSILDPHMKRCVFIGYPDGYKGWKFYDPTTKFTSISECAVFNKRIFDIQNTRCWHHDPKPNQYPELADIPDGNDTHWKGFQIRTN